MKHYLGIDPGQKGGLALISGDGVPITQTVMPPTVAQIAAWIVESDATAIITEKAQVMPKQGAVSGFNYGKHFGIFEAVAYLLKIPYHEVRPAVWKKSMKLTKDKNDSIRLCERLFPEVELVPARCRKPHDGIAEALLIAEWGRREKL